MTPFQKELLRRKMAGMFAGADRALGQRTTAEVGPITNIEHIPQTTAEVGEITNIEPLQQTTAEVGPITSIEHTPQIVPEFGEATFTQLPPVAAKNKARLADRRKQLAAGGMTQEESIQRMADEGTMHPELAARLLGVFKGTGI